MSARQAQQAGERRVQLPLATDVERLVATLMAPQTSLSRKLSAAERLYSLIPTYTLRMLATAATKMVGVGALLRGESDEEYEAKRQFFVSMLRSMLRQMDKTREKIVEVKLPPIPISEELFKGDIMEVIDRVAYALTDWFYAATEEARKRGKPSSYDTEKPGYVLLIGFAALVIVNGLRQLANVGD
jgi:hypothetical protein